jgi:arsenate reductase (thioredoxin)
VVADGGLTEPERLGQMTHACFVAGLSLNQAQKPQARRFAEDAERGTELVGVCLAERAVEERRAVRRNRRDRLHAWILTRIDAIGNDPVLTAVDTREAEMSETLDPITRNQIRTSAQALGEEFAGIFSTATIARYIEESTDLLSGARISTYVPLLVHRFARERLQALAQAQGQVTNEQPEVLFVCVHNAGRSQMAAGLVKLRSDGRIHVRSAGSIPAAQINPAVIEAMEEIGVDLGEEFPKPLTDEVVRAADVVITMGCGDACPIYPGKKYEDWDLDDPAGQDLETVRRIRDQIDVRVRTLIADLLPT